MNRSFARRAFLGRAASLAAVGPLSDVFARVAESRATTHARLLPAGTGTDYPIRAMRFRDGAAALPFRIACHEER